MKRITIKYPYCPCTFGTEARVTDKVEHLRKFVEIHNLSSDRRKKWAQKYLNRDNI